MFDNEKHDVLLGFGCSAVATFLFWKYFFHDLLTDLFGYSTTTSIIIAFVFFMCVAGGLIAGFAKNLAMRRIAYHK